MLKMQQFLLIATASICMWTSPILGQDSPRYAIVLLPSLGGEDSVALGLNSGGEAVGWSHDPVGRVRPTLWPFSGTPVDLGTLGGNFGEANAINDVGTIVGWANLPGGGSFDERAFVYRDGQMEDLGTLGGTESEATDTNANGDIVGWSYLEGDSTRRGFLWRNGRMENLGTIDERSSQAFAIDDSGLIVGQSWSTPFGGWRAVLWQNGQIRDLGTLLNDNTGQSWAYDVNEAGIIVGGAEAGLFHYHAFAWMDGEMYDLSTLPGYGTTHARANNNLNQIVGYATNGAPDQQAFLWEQPAGMQRLSALIPPRSSWRLFEAQDINDAGQIVGYGTHRGSEWLLDAYLATPVHPTMEMMPPSPGIAGMSNTITLTDATPGARVHFLYSQRGGGTRIPGCDLQQNALQLDSPTIIGSAIADANGVASITRTVPLIARGQTILFQAVIQNECAISQLVVHRFD